MKKKVLLFGILLLIIDQLFKQVIIINIPYQKVISILPNFFYLTYVKNTGGAWSIFTGNVIFLLIIGFLCMIGILYYLYKKDSFSKLEIICFSFLIGGILGNIIDRLCYQAVIDYLGFIFGNYYFPIFNLADILIVCGGILFAIGELRGEQNGIRSNKR